jgi:hypothetical protein
MTAIFGVLALGLLFTFQVAQAAESHEYVRTYSSSNDGRSQIIVNSYTSSDSNTSIKNSVRAYTNTDGASDTLHIKETGAGDIYVSVRSTSHQDDVTQGQHNGIDDGENAIASHHLIERIEELLETIRNIIGNQ